MQEDLFKTTLGRLLDLQFALNTIRDYRLNSGDYSFIPDSFYSGHTSRQLQIIHSHSRQYRKPLSFTLQRYFNGEYNVLINELLEQRPAIEDEIQDLINGLPAEEKTAASKLLYVQMIITLDSEGRGKTDFQSIMHFRGNTQDDFLKKKGIRTVNYYMYLIVTWDYIAKESVYYIRNDYPTVYGIYSSGWYRPYESTIYIRYPDLTMQAEFLEQLICCPDLCQQSLIQEVISIYKNIRQTLSKEQYIEILADIVLWHEQGHKEISEYVRDHKYFEEIAGDDEETRRKLSESIVKWDNSLGELIPDIFVIEKIEQLPDNARSLYHQTAYIDQLLLGNKTEAESSHHSITLEYFRNAMSLEELKFLVSEGLKKYNRDHNYIRTLSGKLWEI